MPEKVFEKTDTNAQLKEFTNKLEHGIKNLFEGEKFKKYLNTMSKFHNYSFNNTLLIAMQKPDASLVAGFNSWKNQFGRHVNKGEKGIQILAPAPFKVQKEMEKLDRDTGLPMLDRNGKPVVEEVEVTIPYFKVVSVFDVSQTNGKELPSLGVDELSGEVKNYDKFFEALQSVSPVPVEFEQITDGAKGYYHHEEKRIAINEGMSQSQNVKTAIHEISHAKLHDRDLIKADLADKKDRKTGEVEAESIAYTVCQHYGIDTSDYSFAYIAAWGSGKDTPELKNSLETIRDTASEIINKIDDKLSQLDRNSLASEEQTAEKPEKQSNIIGNMAYKDIEDKNYFKLEAVLAVKIVAELEKQGVAFSGRLNDDTTTLTIGAVDMEKFKVIEKEILAQEKTIQQPAEKAEKPEKSDIIGNTNYADIEDKKFFNIDSGIADKVASELEAREIKFSGKVNDNDKTTFTLNSADTEAFNAVVNEIKGQMKAVQKPIEKVEKPEKSDIIGNAKYADIADKKYFKIDTVLAEKIAVELEKQGVKFSGRISSDKTTLTIGNADVDKYKAAFNTVKNAESEIKAADKMPETPEPDCSFSIYQLSDIPENRDLRFQSLQSLETKGIAVNAEDYTLAYTAALTAEQVRNPQILEDIYERFNLNHPDDFKGHSLSVSDVVVIDNSGKQTVHYCDNIGFAPLPDFFKEKSAEHNKSVENAAPSVADLEAKVNRGETISLMDLAKTVKNEPKTPGKPNKKSSIHEQLHANREKPKLPVKPEYLEVYINNLNFAREHGEIELYKESKKLNLECAAAIDDAIRENSRPGTMAGTQYVDTEKAMKDVTEKFAAERVKAVVAHVVNDHDWDGRLSNTNKDWAKKIDTPCHGISISTHLTIFDSFANKVRDGLKTLDKKSSIHERLNAPEKPQKKVEQQLKAKGDVAL